MNIVESLIYAAAMNLLSKKQTILPAKNAATRAAKQLVKQHAVEHCHVMWHEGNEVLTPVIGQ